MASPERRYKEDESKIPDAEDSVIEPISFRCSSCSKGLRIKNRSKNGRVRCPKCNSIVEIPRTEGRKKTENECWFCKRTPPNLPHRKAACLAILERNQTEDDYEFKSIDIPRCLECKSAHSWPTIPVLIVTAILIVFLLVVDYLLITSDNEFFNWWKIAIVIVAQFFIVHSVTYEITYMLMRFMQRKINPDVIYTKKVRPTIREYLKHNGLSAKGWKTTGDHMYVDVA